MSEEQETRFNHFRFRIYHTELSLRGARALLEDDDSHLDSIEMALNNAKGHLQIAKDLLNETMCHAEES